MATSMESLKKKPAFKSKATVAFAPLSQSMRGTPGFLPIPDGFSITVLFHCTAPKTCGSLCCTLDRAPTGFCQRWCTTSWKVVGDGQAMLYMHF